MSNDNTPAAVPAEPVAPTGWKMVPIEPTEAMSRAAVVYANGNAVYKNVAAEALKIEEGIYAEVYGAMLAAAPQATPPSPDVKPSNVGQWCMSEDECRAAGIDFAAYERGVSDAAEAFGRNK